MREDDKYVVTLERNGEVLKRHMVTNTQMDGDMMYVMRLDHACESVFGGFEGSLRLTPRAVKVREAETAEEVLRELIDQPEYPGSSPKLHELLARAKKALEDSDENT